MRQRIFRLNQEIPAIDLNGMQAFRDVALSTALADAVTDGRGYSGFAVSMTSSTEITVAPGRYYAAGLCYIVETPTVINLLPRLPLATKRKMAIVVWGQEIETDVEPRDFLVDSSTNATEPRAVATTKLRQAQVGEIAGTEAADPPTPAVAPTSLLLAVVTLTPAGVSVIEQEASTRLPTVADTAQGVGELRAWRAGISPRVDTLTTMQLALADATAGKADVRLVFDLSARLADAERRLKIPAGAMTSDTDDFADNSKTDAAATGAGALLDRGLLFPYQSSGTFPLELFNPNDAGVKRSTAGLILPAYSQVLKLTTGTATADIAASSVSVQTWVTYSYVTYDLITRYRPGYTYETVAYGDGTFGSIPHFNGMESYVEWVPVTRYRTDSVSTSYNGMLVAQTLPAPSNMWATAIGLTFTQVGPTDDVVVLLTDTDLGKPNLSKVLARTTVALAALKRAPEKTIVPIEPALLDAGRRYAVVVLTQGAHRLGVVSDFVDGTLFRGSDGDYVAGDLTQDLAVDLYGAAFAAPRSEIMLSPIDLSGGVTDIAADYRRLVPDGCTMALEVQAAGRWYPLGSPDLPTPLPAVVPLRAVLLGSRDLAPGFWAAANVVRASRPALNGTHVSTTRTLPSASADIRVILDLSGWDAARHSLTVTLVKADTSEVTAALVTTEAVSETITRKTFKFTPSPGLSTYKIKIAPSRTNVGSPYYIARRTDVAL